MSGASTAKSRRPAASSLVVSRRLHRKLSMITAGARRRRRWNSGGRITASMRSVMLMRKVLLACRGLKMRLSCTDTRSSERALRTGPMMFCAMGVGTMP
ncbi:hypothetical protein D3C77_701580 [compost metagenome]